MSYQRHIGARQWRRIYDYLQEFSEIYVRNEEHCRRFVEGVFWMARSGAQWRLLPKEYGDWNTVYRRFADWAKKGIWYKMLYYKYQWIAMELWSIIAGYFARSRRCQNQNTRCLVPRCEGVGRSCGTEGGPKWDRFCDALDNSGSDVERHSRSQAPCHDVLAERHGINRERRLPNGANGTLSMTWRWGQKKPSSTVPDGRGRGGSSCLSSLYRFLPLDDKIVCVAIEHSSPDTLEFRTDVSTRHGILHRFLQRSRGQTRKAGFQEISDWLLSY
ncbi:MAG: transposase [Rhodospirillales bacterium]|nr:transposase [Rhodospirillales bacterium]